MHLAYWGSWACSNSLTSVCTILRVSTQCQLGSTSKQSSAGNDFGITSNNLHMIHRLRLAVSFEYCILQYESPHIVTESVGVQMTLASAQHTRTC